MEGLILCEYVEAQPLLAEKCENVFCLIVFLMLRITSGVLYQGRFSFVDLLTHFLFYDLCHDACHLHRPILGLKIEKLRARQPDNLMFCCNLLDSHE